MPETSTKKEAAFVCQIPGCSHSFKHKEHLNRHQANHAGLQLHECPTCARAFTRRDTLNRHMALHTKPPRKSKRISIACQTCRERKTKCNIGEPCLTCYNMQVPCVRVASSSQNAHNNMANVNFLHSNCEGHVTQPMGLPTDKKKVPYIPQSYYGCPMWPANAPSQMLVGYPLEQQDFMADIALPADMVGGMAPGSTPLVRGSSIIFDADRFI